MMKFRAFLTLLAAAVLTFAGPAASGQDAPPFSQLVVFGDSLSDTGNVANVTEGRFGITYPGNDFNYSDGRFTNGPDTSPPEVAYDGVWHEQLARVFFNLPRAKPSTGGGFDYAYGGATTKDGTKDVTVISNPIPFGGGRLTITIKNMGQQVSDFLGRNPQPDPAALYIVWGGGNDLFNDPSASNVTDAATRIPMLVERLARAGAVNFLVPNAPPLGSVPRYADDPGQAATLNQAAADFRDQLNANLDALQARLDAEGIPLRLYRLDVYELFGRFAANPAAYNITNNTQPAQDRADQAERYLFWDDIHPTTGGHYQLAVEAYTLLTGVPVVQIAPAKTDINLKTGEMGRFFLTRSGLDLSTSYAVPYTVSGSAVAGTDYSPLKGKKTFLAGKRTTKINVFTIPAAPGAPSKGIKLTLQPADPETLPPDVTPYHLPVLTTSKINLRTDR